MQDETNEAKVKAQWPDAFAYLGITSVWHVFSDRSAQYDVLGAGATETEAWSDATSRLPEPAQAVATGLGGEPLMFDVRTKSCRDNYHSDCRNTNCICMCNSQYNAPQPNRPQASAGMIPKLSDQFLLENVDAESCNVGPSESYLQASAGAEPEPLPCPFCNSGANIARTEERDGHMIFCPNEECFVQPETGYFSKEAEAVQCWNTRATPGPDPRDAEILRLKDELAEEKGLLTKHGLQYKLRAEAAEQQLATAPELDPRDAEIARLKGLYGDVLGRAVLFNARAEAAEAQLATAREVVGKLKAYMPVVVYEGPTEVEWARGKMRNAHDEDGYLWGPDVLTALTPATDKEAQG